MAQLTAEGIRKYQVLVATGNHAILADEPKTIGDGLGPDPYELLLSALGSCTVMTVEMYARRKRWPLEKVRVALTFDRVHAEDCADCETKEGFIERITVKLQFDGELSPEQTERLGAIAGRCPVMKTLQARPHIAEEVIEELPPASG